MRPNEPRYTEAFMEFWLVSTMRGSKLAAFKAWQKIQPTSGLIPEMVEAMLAWQMSEQWQDETKQPHVSTWLNRRGWEEIIPLPTRHTVPARTYTPEEQARLDRQIAELEVVTPQPVAVRDNAWRDKPPDWSHEEAVAFVETLRGMK